MTHLLVQQIYIGLLGRAADKAGLEYWTNEIESGALTLEQLRANIVNEQPEYAEGMGSMTRAQVVSSLYQNLFDRAPDDEGLDYWVNGGGADVNVDQLVLALIEGASASDTLALDNKATVAQAYTQAAGDAYTEASAEAVIADVDGAASSRADALESIENMNFSSGGTIVKAFNDDNDNDALNESVNTIYHVGREEFSDGVQTTTAEDYTFTLSDQIGADEVYSGQFLSPILSAGTLTQNSQLFIELLDLRAADSGEPLGNLPVDGFRFTLNGEEVTITSPEIDAAKTYEDLQVAVQSALEASDDPRLAGFSAELGGAFQAVENGQPIPGAVGTRLVLTDANGGEIEEGGFSFSEAATSGFTLYGEQTTEAPEVVQKLVTTNLELSNIGYGSQGGSVNLNNESNSNAGVEQMNVNAENGVWLSQLLSRDTLNNTEYRDHLQTINLTGSGEFKVGQQSLDGESVVGLQDMLTSNGEIIAGAPDTDNNLTDTYNGFAGLVDVQNFNGADFAGAIEFNAYLTEAVVERDLDAGDTQDSPAADNALYSYTTAAGDDEVNVFVDLAVLEREDAALRIDTNDGNDVVETGLLENGELTDQQLNANMAINTGAGDDLVRAWGAGDAIIDTAAGNDVIYADNSGDGVVDAPLDEATYGFQRDVWEFNSTGTDVSGPTGVSNSDSPLSSDANNVDQTFNGVFKTQVQVSFKGFESQWVTIESTNENTTTLQINQAIKEAVNNDDVLSKLIEANDGDGNILDIESLIDGNNLDQLGVEFREPLAIGSPSNDGQPVLVTGEVINTTSLADAEAIYAQAPDTLETDVGTSAGDISGVESDNTITAGAGDDVVVLGTGANSNDTLVFAGEFGNDSIVNFTAAAASTGNDILDFTSYGVASGANAAVAGFAAGNDLVHIADFATSPADDADTTFDNLDAAAVDAALGVASSSTTQLDSILLVEDDATGVYKAFDIEVAANSTDYTVTLIGTMDFGASVDVANVDIA